MPTPTKRHINWVGTQIVTTVPSAATIVMTGVQSIAIDHQGEVQEFSGDGDRYPTTIVNTFSNPMVTVEYADLNAAHGLLPGTRGALTATHQDAKNLSAVGGGGYLMTLSNAMVRNTTSDGKHRGFGSCQTILSAESTDGVTNPLAFAAV